MNKFFRRGLTDLPKVDICPCVYYNRNELEKKTVNTKRSYKTNRNDLPSSQPNEQIYRFNNKSFKGYLRVSLHFYFQNYQ